MPPVIRPDYRARIDLLSSSSEDTLEFFVPLRATRVPDLEIELTDDASMMLLQQRPRPSRGYAWPTVNADLRDLLLYVVSEIIPRRIIEYLEHVFSGRRFRRESRNGRLPVLEM